jgi:hypothetical protein
MLEKDFMGESAARGALGRVLYGRGHTERSRKHAEGSTRDLRPLLDKNQQAR